MKRIDFVKIVKEGEKEGREADLMIDFLEYRFIKGYASLILVVGARGTGKSSTCYRLSEKNNERLNHLREKMGLEKKEFGTYIDSHLNLIHFVKNAQMGDDAILEEISVLYPSRRSMSEESVGVSKVLDIIRKKRLIIYANTPMALSTDKNIRMSANAMILTFKILKGEQVVLSRFWKLQPNYLSGKIYTHSFTRKRREAQIMYTKMPDIERWAKYEKSKDEFIDDTYKKLLRKAELKQEKELKELGLQKIIRKPLTPKQEEIVKVLAYNNGEETAVILNITPKLVSKQKQAILKKGYTIKEFRKNNTKPSENGNI